MAAPIGNTCPDIDKAIKRLKSGMEELKGLLKYCSDETIESRYRDIDSVIDYMHDTIDSFEDLRRDNDTLRKWGQEMEEEAESATVQYNELEEKYNKVLEELNSLKSI